MNETTADPTRTDITAAYPPTSSPSRLDIEAARIAPEDCYSIRRDGTNDDYEMQDLPFACFPSKVGKVYRAGTVVGGRLCPRCSVFIAVTSRVVRLRYPEQDRWWVHARCSDAVEVEEVRR